MNFTYTEEEVDKLFLDNNKRMEEILEKHGFKRSKTWDNGGGEFQKDGKDNFYLVDIDPEYDMLIERDPMSSGNYLTIFEGKYLDPTQLDIILKSLDTCS